MTYTVHRARQLIASFRHAADLAVFVAACSPALLGLSVRAAGRVIASSRRQLPAALFDSYDLLARELESRAQEAIARTYHRDAAWESEGRLRDMEGTGNYAGPVTWP